MVNDPPKPRGPGPRDPLDLLRELARGRAPEEPAPGNPAPTDPKLDELRALAARLDRQLRAPPAAPGTDAHNAPPPAAWPQESYQESHQQSYREPHQDSYQDASAQSPDRYPPRPARRLDLDAWRRSARAEWAAFRDGLPAAHDLVPRLDVREIAFAAIAAAVLVASAIGAFVLHGRPALLPGTNEPVVPGIPSPYPAPGAPPAAQEPAMPTVADVKQAMSECDAAAAQDPDSLYFLVLPLLRANPADTAWNPVPLQTIGSGYTLLGASDALEGLGSGKLKVRDGRYTFAVLDPVLGTTWSWTSATRMSRLARKDPGGVKTLKLGFDFSPAQAGPQWSAEFKRDRGTCYWVSVLVQ